MRDTKIVVKLCHIRRKMRVCSRNAKFYKRRWIFRISQQSDEKTLLRIEDIDNKCNMLVSDGWELENCWHEHLVCDSQRRVCEQ